MKLFIHSLKYRLKQNLTAAGNLVMLALALAAAVYPLFIINEQEKQQQPVPIGWVDQDNSFYSEKLLESMTMLDLLEVKPGGMDQLIGELRTGKLEAVFVVNEGFEEKIMSGEYEDTLTMYKSPYSSVAAIISEGVGAEVMHLWLAQYSAIVASEYDSALETKVFDEVMAYMVKPIMNIERVGDKSSLEAADPLPVAAKKSVFLAAAICCLFMLLGSVNAASSEFAQRLRSRNASLSSFSLAVSITDAVFFLPCVLPSSVVFIITGDYAGAGVYILMFALYLFAFGGIASALGCIKSKTIHMMSITVISIVNLGFGSLLLNLPEIGIVPKLAYLLPSRWLSSVDLNGVWACLAGLAVCAAVYNSIVFLRAKRKREV